MFLLNLSLAEFLAIFGILSGVVVALYLLDRARQRETVASLRFWMSAQRPAERRSRRKRIQQPWSLVLQLLGILCLLLAVAQLRLGAPQGAGRDHVLILDTSAWMNAGTGSARLIDQARDIARRWLRTLPASDRVMVIHANAVATPVTGFEADRKVIERAIGRSEPGGTALDLGKAFELARQVLRLHSSRAGEIVLASAGRIAESDSAISGEIPPNLRVLPLQGIVDNRGLRRVGLERSPSSPSLWKIFVSVRNDGPQPRAVDLAILFGGAPMGIRRLSVPPAGEENATFELRTRAAGSLEVRLLGSDDFPADDRAVLELPAQRVLRVAVFSARPESLRPVLAANPHVEAQFHRPSDYGSAGASDVVILDGFAPPEPPQVDCIWIEPPAERGPVRVTRRVSGARLSRWRSDDGLAAGLRTEDLQLQTADVFAPEPGDITVAEVEQGPVILARPGKPKAVILGFHPMRSAMRYQLVAPLLFANILRWMSPELFRRWELSAGSAGSVSAPVDPGQDPAAIRVVAGDQAPLPFTVSNGNLRFFTGAPGTVRVKAGDREMVYSLTLPDAGGPVWQPPAWVSRGLPRAVRAGAAARDLWRILAIAGGLALLADWLLFGRRRSSPGPAISRTPLSSMPGRLRALFQHVSRKAS